jgi:uncharacterized protein (UPF0335 family)
MAKAPASDRDVGLDDNDPTFDVGEISGARLRSFIERIERVQEEIRALQADVKEIKSEAKGTGFDIKVINHLLKIRRQDKDDLDEFESLVDVYKRAIGI